VIAGVIDLVLENLCKRRVRKVGTYRNLQVLAIADAETFLLLCFFRIPVNESVFVNTDLDELSEACGDPITSGGSFGRLSQLLGYVSNIIAGAFTSDLIAL
jgi:hypothetical protein